LITTDGSGRLDKNKGYHFVVQWFQIQMLWQIMPVKSCQKEEHREDIGRCAVDAALFPHKGAVLHY